MTTLIDWRLLESKVELNQNNWGYEKRSQALAHVLLETLFDLDSEEIGDAIRCRLMRSGRQTQHPSGSTYPD